MERLHDSQIEVLQGMGWEQSDLQKIGENSIITAAANRDLTLRKGVNREQGSSWLPFGIVLGVGALAVGVALNKINNSNSFDTISCDIVPTPEIATPAPTLSTPGEVIRQDVARLENVFLSRELNDLNGLGYAREIIIHNDRERVSINSAPKPTETPLTINTLKPDQLIQDVGECYDKYVTELGHRGFTWCPACPLIEDPEPMCGALTP